MEKEKFTVFEYDGTLTEEELKHLDEEDERLEEIEEKARKLWGEGALRSEK